MTQIVTANRLTDGAVVFLGDAGRWVETIGEAHVAVDDTALSTLMGTAESAVRARQVVEPYPIAVTLRETGPWPVRYREAIRARGPSVRADLGKQAAGR